MGGDEGGMNIHLLSYSFEPRIGRIGRVTTGPLSEETLQYQSRFLSSFKVEKEIKQLNIHFTVYLPK